MSQDNQQPPTAEWPELAEFKQQFRQFVAEHEWDQFHSPKPAMTPGFRSEVCEAPSWCHGGCIAGRSRKSGAIAGSNLAMALTGEAGELLELFQWLTQEESRNLPDDAEQAAIFDRLGIDIGPAVAKKYPADLARGNALKYSRMAKF